MKLSKIILGERKKQDISQKWANYKGPFKKGDEWSEIEIVTEQEYYLGYDLDQIESLVKYLETNYEEGTDYISHIGRGDDLPNAITLINSRLEGDNVLMTLIDLAEDEIVKLSGLREQETELEEGKPGLWANINAKKKRGEKPSHGNSNAHKDAVAAGKAMKKQVKLVDIIFETITKSKIYCDNCSWSWDIKDGGDDLYVCHKCGHNNKPQALENFKDGKKKGKSKPGRVNKSGASCKGSVTDLRAKAKKYGGEKGKMYHWCANMKSSKSGN